jgi:hypothetical protein
VEKLLDMLEKEPQGPKPTCDAGFAIGHALAGEMLDAKSDADRGESLDLLSG